MSHEVESMAYANEVPWHGLGVQVDSTWEPDAMAVAAGVDWEVRALSIKAQNPDTKKYSIPVEDFNVITRMSDHKILGPCGPKWKPVQNMECIDFFKKFTEAGHMTMETVGSLDGGKQVWGLAKLQKEIVLPGDDVVSGYLLLSNPHIWGKSMTIMFTPIRVVCMNTFMVALKAGGKKFRHPHSIKWSDEQAAKAEEALGIGELLTEDFGAKAQRLAETQVDTDIVDYYLAKVLSPQAVTETKKSIEIDRGALNRRFETVKNLVTTQPGANLKSSEGTLWGAFNAVTYFFDHEYGKSVDTRMTSSWFGANRITKEKAFEEALNVADKVAA